MDQFCETCDQHLPDEAPHWRRFCESCNYQRNLDAQRRWRKRVAEGGAILPALEFCIVCNERIPDDRPGGRKRRFCSDECREVETRKHRSSWRKRYPEKSRKHHQRFVAKLRVVIREAKAGGCAHCDEKDWAVLDFHHVRGEKLFTIGSPSKAASHGMEALHAEIAKCEVLCANCHRRVHARR